MTIPSLADRILIASLPREHANVPSYYEALGRFITTYARAEIQVHVLARKYSTANEEQARILLHRLGLTKVMELLRELIGSQTLNAGLLEAVTRQSLYKEVDACLSHLAVISGRRGDLVHRMSLTTDSGFSITNEITAKKLASYERTIITLPELKAMTHDCWTIYMRLSRIANPPKEPLTPDPFPALSTASWQYKLPPQTPRKEPRIKARKERKLQRRASGS